MKKIWIILFIVVLIGDLAAILSGNEEVQYFFKPLIIPALAGYFYSATKTFLSGLSKWVFAALFFSWTGDILLMFQDNDPIFFLLGLSSFLLAHVFYIVFFHRIRIQEGIKSNPWLLLVVVVYYAVLISLLSPFLGEMKIPVRIYGIVISFMFMLAMHLLFIKNRAAGQWMMTGAGLFVISDSVLAINKFYQPFEVASILVMVTYGLAQLFIIEGAIKYIRNRE